MSSEQITQSIIIQIDELQLEKEQQQEQIELLESQISKLHDAKREMKKVETDKSEGRSYDKTT